MNANELKKGDKVSVELVLYGPMKYGRGEVVEIIREEGKVRVNLEGGPEMWYLSHQIHKKND